MVLADDHTLFREGTRQLLERDPGIEVVAEAGDGEQAVVLVDRHAPNVAVLDIEMPVCNGIEATRRIKDAHPEVAVLVLTMHDEEPFVFAILEAGAAGYLLKDVHSTELIRAVRAIADGESVLHPSITRQVLSRVRRDGGPGPPPQRELNEEELQVLRRAAGGDTNRQMAQELGVSVRTVQMRLHRCFDKLQVASRTEAIVRALKEGLFTLDEVTRTDETPSGRGR